MSCIILPKQLLHGILGKIKIGLELKAYTFVDFLDFDNFGAIVSEDLSAIWGLSTVLICFSVDNYETAHR